MEQTRGGTGDQVKPLFESAPPPIYQFHPPPHHYQDHQSKPRPLLSGSIVDADRHYDPPYDNVLPHHHHYDTEYNDWRERSPDHQQYSSHHHPDRHDDWSHDQGSHYSWSRSPNNDRFTDDYHRPSPPPHLAPSTVDYQYDQHPPSDHVRHPPSDHVQHLPMPTPHEVIKKVVPAENIFDSPGRDTRPSHVSHTQTYYHIWAYIVHIRLKYFMFIFRLL